MNDISKENKQLVQDIGQLYKDAGSVEITEPTSSVEALASEINAGVLDNQRPNRVRPLLTVIKGGKGRIKSKVVPIKNFTGDDNNAS